MANYTAPDRSALAGIPSQGSDTIGVTAEGLLTGDFPKVFNEDMTVAASQTLAAYTVVGLDASGDIVKATWAADDSGVEAIGIIPIAVTSAASGTKIAAPVYRGGCFNPAMLVWDATYDTAEKKLEAFRGAPAPTQIVIRPIKTASITLP